MEFIVGLTCRLNVGFYTTPIIYYSVGRHNILFRPSAGTFLPLTKAENMDSFPCNAHWADYIDTLNKLGIPDEKVNFNHLYFQLKQPTP
jgi:hypothetical protein